MQGAKHLKIHSESPALEVLITESFLFWRGQKEEQARAFWSESYN